MSKEPDVTAVVLNWARLENVKVIVADLCSEELRDTISSVIVWNNQPKLALSDAVSLACVPPRRRSEHNNDRILK